MYLAVLLDLYSRRIVGWAMRPTLDTDVVCAAWQMAVVRRRPAAGLIHHSDRGCQLGFKGSSQRVCVSSSLSDFAVPPLAFSNRVSFAVDC
jgi:transposase InsO family protein